HTTNTTALHKAQMQILNIQIQLVTPILPFQPSQMPPTQTERHFSSPQHSILFCVPAPDFAMFFCPAQ
ncbi:hypothetical protein, partial [Escherichia coli]|uniref:hypothetical protein n=1 Tax=Escherichia coli TaxID=562 RepID=UPI001A7E1033